MAIAADSLIVSRNANCGDAAWPIRLDGFDLEIQFEHDFSFSRLK